MLFVDFELDFVGVVGEDADIEVEVLRSCVGELVEVDDVGVVGAGDRAVLGEDRHTLFGLFFFPPSLSCCFSYSSFSFSRASSSSFSFRYLSRSLDPMDFLSFSLSVSEVALFLLFVSGDLFIRVEGDGDVSLL